MNILHYDLCVIGGGINGAGIARDAAGRGLSVLLVEAQDLAGATSSASTKLIHGGIRYLESYDFGMVHKSLKEREVIYKNTQHLVRPIECVLLQNEECRPQWMTRFGVWIYDHLGGKKTLPKSRMISFADDVYGVPLQKGIKDGLVYSDCWVDDTRLVVMNVVDAAARKAKILTYTTCEHLEVSNGRWRVGLRDSRSGDRLDISASMVVNATGPWVGKFLSSVGVDALDPDLPAMRLVKGSHIILPRLYDGDHAYVVQRPDKRIVFIAPYQGAYTLIGTTEEGFEGDPRDARLSDAEMTYLCDAVNETFLKAITPADVLFSFSGVRPLWDDGQSNASKVTRDYMIYHHKRYDPPLVSVFGGKLTTYRLLSEDVLDKLMRVSGRVGHGWTARHAIAGGDFGVNDFNGFFSVQQSRYPWLPKALLMRYARAYGSHMDYFLYGKASVADLGVCYGDDAYQAEVEYLVRFEYATSAEDIIWRRSKLGLYCSDATIDNIEVAVRGLIG